MKYVFTKTENRFYIDDDGRSITLVCYFRVHRLFSSEQRDIKTKHKMYSSYLTLSNLA